MTTENPAPDTHPVVDRPDSVTHWTCPKSPYGETHHIIRDNCKYCHEGTTALRRIQETILNSQKG